VCIHLFSDGKSPLFSRFEVGNCTVFVFAGWVSLASDEVSAEERLLNESVVRLDNSFVQSLPSTAVFAWCALWVVVLVNWVLGGSYIEVAAWRLSSPSLASCFSSVGTFVHIPVSEPHWRAFVGFFGGVPVGESSCALGSALL